MAEKVTLNPAKRQTTLDDRGLNFADASIVFAGPTITIQERRRDYGEKRFQTVRFLAGWWSGRPVEKRGT